MQIDPTLAISLYQSGMTAVEVAGHIGCSKQGVLRVLVVSGIERRAPKPRTPMLGPANPNWKGGTYKSDDGYVMQWTPNGHKRAHRLVTGAASGQIVHGNYIHEYS